MDVRVLALQSLSLKRHTHFSDFGSHKTSSHDRWSRVTEKSTLVIQNVKSKLRNSTICSPSPILLRSTHLQRTSLQDQSPPPTYSAPVSLSVLAGFGCGAAGLVNQNFALLSLYVDNPRILRSGPKFTQKRSIRLNIEPAEKKKFSAVN